MTSYDLMVALMWMAFIEAVFALLYYAFSAVRAGTWNPRDERMAVTAIIGVVVAVISAAVGAGSMYVVMSTSPDSPPWTLGGGFVAFVVGVWFLLLPAIFFFGAVRSVRQDARSAEAGRMKRQSLPVRSD